VPKSVSYPLIPISTAIHALHPLANLVTLPLVVRRYFFKNLAKRRRRRRTLVQLRTFRALAFQPKASARFFFRLHRLMLRFSIYRLSRDLPILNPSLPVAYKFALSPIANDRLTVQLFSRFVVRRLAQRFNLFETVKVLQRFLANSSLRGYLLRCSGRFTKKQRASLYTFRKGAATVGTVGAPVHYYDATVRLKYGACCIKTWIYR
jgi:hypothetical protein